MRTLLSYALVFIILLGHFVVPATRGQEQRGVALNAAPSGSYYALVIGNNAYQKIRPLQTAEADAREVETLLKTQYGFQTKLLLNATRQQIVSALYGYRRVLNENANLLIYYAGHGVNDRDADKAYWLPVDAELEDNSNWISADDITTNIKVIPAKHILIVSDSCYSGTLTRGLGEYLPRPTEREQFIRKMAAGKSRTLMASGGNEPVADGGGGKHSVFAAALLRGLREIDKAQFTAGELFRYHVEEPVAGRANQTPEYNPLRNSGHENGDFIFIRIKTDGKNVELTIKAPTGPTAAAVDPAAIELSFWESIKGSTDVEDFKAYLEAYPAGRFAPLARNNMRRLEAASKAAAPAPTTATNTSAPKGPVSGGVLNGKAISKPSPVYPEAANAARAQGTVQVQITVDEEGKVISAKAVSGHALLQQAAVDAALQARFNPTLRSGQAVKVTGIITYNFVLSEKIGN